MCADKNGDRGSILLRPSAAVLLAVGGFVGVLLALVFVMPRVARRNWEWLTHNTAVMRVLNAYNDFTRRTSGSPRSPFALLTHVGRRSGRTYETSLGACAYGDGFVLPLAYGSGVDWCRNVMAACGASLTWKGQVYELEQPELITGSEVMQTWPPVQRMTLQVAGIHDFLWLHEKRPKAAQVAEAGLKATSEGKDACG